MFPHSLAPSVHAHPFDVAVIGAGVMGSAAACALASRGCRVLLLEQFSVGHTHGSSHGGSRIVRYAHPEVDYAALMPAIFDRWRAIEDAYGEPLLDLCGGLYVATPDDPFLTGSMRTLNALGMPFTPLDCGQIEERFPQFRVRTEEVAFVEPNAGVVAASRSVQALVTLAARSGAVLRQGWRVRRVIPRDGEVLIECDASGTTETIQAPRVVIAAGPWAEMLLRTLIGESLPLRVTRQQVAYVRVQEPEFWLPRRCPIFIFTSDPPIYGFPIYEQPGLIKVAQELFDLETDPDAAREPDPHATARLVAAIRARLRDVDAQPVRIDACVYTETPTRDFIIDRHPEYPQIVFAAGFSGRGFKFAPGVGDLLAHLALMPQDDYAHPMWLPRFAVRNFLDVEPSATATDIFRRL